MVFNACFVLITRNYLFAIDLQLQSTFHFAVTFTFYNIRMEFLSFFFVLSLPLLLRTPLPLANHSGLVISLLDLFLPIIMHKIKSIREH